MFRYVDYIAQFQIFILSTEDIKMKKRPREEQALPALLPRFLFAALSVLYNLGYLKPNTHRRRRRDSTVELSRVGGVY